MKRIMILIAVVVLSSGCALLNGGAYNSRNVIDVKATPGQSMHFNYGLISVDNVDRVIVLRETNAGNKPAPEPLPPYDSNSCPADLE